MPNQIKKIGVIGLGIMGAPMARNLLKAGFDVIVYNRSPEKSRDLAASGAAVAENPRSLALACDAVITMVTGPEALWSLCRGDSGLLAADGTGKLLLQCSTIDGTTTISLAEQAQAAGYRLIDCPVSGSKKQVEAAELIFDVGGATVDIAVAAPIFQALGKHVVHAGPVGAGTSLKLCLNLLVAQMTTGLCEAVMLARATGIDPKRVFEVLEHSPALNCGYFTIKKEPLLAQDYPPAFSLANMLKDVKFMNQTAAQHGLELRVTQAVAEVLTRASQQGWDSADLTALCRGYQAGAA